VVQVGDVTTGAFSDTRDFVLPNGFWTRIPTSEVRFADGNSYEGIGIEPHIAQACTREELLSGKDAVLEKALSILK
jgi:C-terminal processing protease CtpA/Prc